MKKIKIGLLSHYYEDPNLGCVALSICNMKLIDEVAKELNIPIEYNIMVNEKQPHLQLDFTENDYIYSVYSSCKKTITHPFKWLHTNIFDDTHIVFNLCAGDGFTDIYGLGRTLSESYMTILSNKNGCPVILSPQTIGPFNKAIAKKIGNYTMNCCKHIFTRDNQSTEYCKTLGFGNKTDEVIDVAFALPFFKEKVHFEETEKINIGINISGLLYRGGYDHNNYFGLTFSYKNFIEKLIRTLLDHNYNVHLISHVITKDGSIEDDYTACQEVHRFFPETILAPKYESPIDVKSYISRMDLFTGARMHSTIAAFSSGVPVVPIAYSRKFNGLFNTLKYDYYIDAKSKEKNMDEAIEFILECIKNKEILKSNLDYSENIFKNGLEKYKSYIGTILEELLYE